MGRYFRFDTNTIDFATRCDINWRKDYFMDFVFGGDRSQRVNGLTKITPELTCAYDVDGLKILSYVMGSLLTGTILVSEPTEIGTMHVGVDGENAGILNSKIDTWELTVEEGAPARVEFNAIGKDTTTVAPTAYTADFSRSVLMPNNFGLTIGTNSIDFSRFALRLNNNIEPIFKTGTVPATLRAQGFEVGGRIRLPAYVGSNMTDSSLCVVCGTIGTIFVGNVKFTEIPPRVTGYDLPETEYSFQAFPSAGVVTLKAILGNTVIW